MLKLFSLGRKKQKRAVKGADKEIERIKGDLTLGVVQINRRLSKVQENLSTLFPKGSPNK